MAQLENRPLVHTYALITGIAPRKRSSSTRMLETGWAYADDPPEQIEEQVRRFVGMSGWRRIDRLEMIVSPTEVEVAPETCGEATFENCTTKVLIEVKR